MMETAQAAVKKERDASFALKEEVKQLRSELSKNKKAFETASRELERIKKHF